MEGVKPTKNNNNNNNQLTVYIIAYMRNMLAFVLIIMTAGRKLSVVHLTHVGAVLQHHSLLYTARGNAWNNVNILFLCTFIELLSSQKRGNAIQLFLFFVTFWFVRIFYINTIWFCVVYVLVLDGDRYSEWTGGNINIY